MSKYMHVLGEAVPAVRQAQGAANMVVTRKSPLFDPSRLPLTDKDLLFTVVGGVAGFMMFKKHRVLGTLGGVTLGACVEPMMRGQGNDRSDAMYRMAIAGAATMSALHFKHHPALAYMGAGVSAALLSTYIDNSPMNRMAKRLEAEKA